MITSKSRVIEKTKLELAARDEEIEQALIHFGEGNEDFILQIMFDPRWMGDLDMLAEYMVLGYLYQKCLDMGFGSGRRYRQAQFTLSNEPNYWGEHNWTGHIHQIARYGYLDSDVLLHYYNQIHKHHWNHYGGVTGSLEPTLDQWNYWTRAQWANELARDGLTPQTWFDKGYANVPSCEHGWVVKGTVRSCRQDWHNRMYATTRNKLHSVINRLLDDSFISKYGLMIREYLPLMQLREFIPDSEVADAFCEYRIHINQGRIIQAFDYWNPDIVSGTLDQAVLDFALLCYNQAEYQGWAVVDVARLEKGGLICIEMNCGPTSGIADPIDFWLSFLNNYKHKDENAILNGDEAI